MPHIDTQAKFRRWPKPEFCYLCGGPLNNGVALNDDHCPPEGMFAISDRENYPIKIPVHAQCNHQWHVADEKLSIFFDVLHGGLKASNPCLQKKLTFVDVENEQGKYQGISNFPLRSVTHRIIRCAHALLYGEFLPTLTTNHIHYPIPEVDPSNNNKPRPHLLQTYAFANSLCIAQKTKTYDSIIAYNKMFRYVCTWSKFDSGQPICIFALDIYRLSSFAVQIHDFPESIIGFYAVTTAPKAGTKCSRLHAENTNAEILYPILET